MLSGLYNDPTQGFVGPAGEYKITDEPDESGQIGNISFENFETITFTVAPGGPVDGTSGDDTLEPGDVDAQQDTIDGSDGLNDTIFGYSGDDVIDGGIGDDTIYGGAGADTFELNGAGLDNDVLIGGEVGDAAGDKLDASAQNGDLELTLTAPETGTLTGGVDTVNFSEIEQFQLGSGDDKAYGSSGGDTIDGGSGADTLSGSGGDDVLSGGAGDDTIDGGSGNDTLDGGSGDDTIDGGSGNDFITGGAGNDLVKGRPGDDTIDGGSGSDKLQGGAGNDTFLGSDGNDIVNGSTGDDTYTADTPALDDNRIEATVNIGANDTVQKFDDAGVLQGTDTLTGDTVEEIVAGESGDPNLNPDVITFTDAIDVTDLGDPTFFRACRV